MNLQAGLWGVPKIRVPSLVPLIIRCRNIIYNQRGPIILRIALKVKVNDLVPGLLSQGYPFIVHTMSQLRSGLGFRFGRVKLRDSGVGFSSRLRFIPKH